MDDVFKRYNFLEKELLNEISRTGIRKIFEANELIVREGQFITSFPLIIHGMVRVSRTNDDGNELLLYYLKENEMCAMSLTCCMSDMTSNVIAVAETETEALMLPVSMLDRWMREFPLWRQYVMQNFQLRFRELINTIDSIAFLKLDERLVKYFLDRYQKTGEATYAGTHQELAIQLNTSREVVSRLLKKLENEGKIELSRNFIDFSGLM